MLKSGYIFTPFEAPEQSPFDKLFDIFSELITHTSGDVDEALDWLKILDKEYSLTSDEYTMDDFIEDLKKKGYLREEIQPNGDGQLAITAKTERVLRKNALDQIFGKIRKSGTGNHKSKKSGQGDELTGDFRNFQFGDSIENISITESLKNSQINNGVGDFQLTEQDLARIVRRVIRESAEDGEIDMSNLPNEIKDFVLRYGDVSSNATDEEIVGNLWKLRSSEDSDVSRHAIRLTRRL